MADQNERVNVNTPQNNDQNTNTSVPDNSNYQAWTQYWQHYYSYYMHYYTMHYYAALCQNPAGFSTVSAANVQPPIGPLNGARIQQNHQPDLRQRFYNAGLFGAGDFGLGNHPPERYEYKVASLGKRVFAEFIDFVFSYFLMYSLFLLYYKDPDKIHSQYQYILVIDDNTSIKDIADVVVQTLVYRFIVFLYETLFMAVPFPCKIGGATLGKYMMGITVVSYPSLTPIEGQNMRRFTGNAQRLSLLQSCVRASMKNVIVTFFFPLITFTTMFLQSFRTPYDIVARSIVVDANPKRLTQEN